MKFARILASILLSFLTSALFLKGLLAQESNQFITVVNPVRISTYTVSAKENLEVQYSIVLENELNATWLLTFDALIDDGVYSVVTLMDDGQEVGIFLEVTSELAEAAGVSYNDTGSWHHATSVFLSGYSQEERVKLIDAVFATFRERYSYYPTSVGSWWTDSFSLSYMIEKYGITANLGVADQFSTDGYQVWGQYFSTPFYPSKYHAGIPAANEEVKLDVVTMQWAPRDPYNGYKSSLYSTQDYHVGPENLKIDYFEKLIFLYAGQHNNEFGQITVGLEGDLSAGAYTNDFAQKMQLVGDLVSDGQFEDINMGKFSKWYRERYSGVSPSQTIETDDLLKEPVKTIWYQSPKYRVGIVHNYNSGETKIMDFRSYHPDFQEPYYQSPNSEFTLSIYVPSYFDEIGNPEDVWKINIGDLKKSENNNEEAILIFENGRIVLTPDKLTVEGKNIHTPTILTQSQALDVILSDGLVDIVPINSWIVGREGLIFRDLTDMATHHLERKRTTAIFSLSLILLLSFGFLVKFSKISERKKLVLLTFIIVPPLLYFHSWYKKNTTEYFVSQGEVDALFRLSNLSAGKVVVQDKECLGCGWHSEFKPAVFANKRNYVQKYGKHSVVYNSSIFSAENQQKAKDEFEKLNARYIYLAKYEDYIERTPFSPGDLGIEKIYANANAEIWRVKD